MLEHIPSAQATCDVETLLPLLVFSHLTLTPLLRPTISLQRRGVLVVLVLILEIKVQIKSIQHPARDLTPDSLPPIRVGSSPGSPHACPGPRQVRRPLCASIPQHLLFFFHGETAFASRFWAVGTINGL